MVPADAGREVHVAIETAPRLLGEAAGMSGIAPGMVDELWIGDGVVVLHGKTGFAELADGAAEIQRRVGIPIPGGRGGADPLTVKTVEQRGPGGIDIVRLLAHPGGMG